MTKKPTPGYLIGRGKPPVHSRFKSGVSGNPAGRKPGALGFKTLLKLELSSHIALSEGTKSQKVTKRFALVKRHVNKALQGDDKSFARLLPLILEIDGELESKQSTKELNEAERLILRRHARRLLEELAEEEYSDE